MKIHETRLPPGFTRPNLFRRAGGSVLGALLCAGAPSPAWTQDAPPLAVSPLSTEAQVERLTRAMSLVEAQMEANQKQLQELRQQLNALQRQMAVEKGSPAPPNDNEAEATAAALNAATAATSLDEMRERQAIAEAQLATHDVSKVETESKYPLKISGLLLFNGFVNTRQMDMPAAPAYAIQGPGSTGFSARQTVLGFDARGPHILGASSRADLRVDFFGNAAPSNYTGWGALRLRTAHAELDWKNTQAFFELDRTILEPYAPSSLVAVAQPELAWAGNLWNWSPQVGVSHDFALSDTSRVKIQGALLDTFDPQPPGITSTTTVTQTERSRWPGTEARIALQKGLKDGTAEVGAGGYFSPHRSAAGDTFDAWAGTADLHLPMTRHFDFLANAYRGQALDGLGAAGYVNYYYYFDAYPYRSAHALDDVGGWAQVKARAGQRVEFNTGFGIDNPFAKEVETAAAYIATTQQGNAYVGLARNRSVYSNAIWSPSAYLQFSLEYRRFWSTYASGPAVTSDSIGLGAGYKF